MCSKTFGSDCYFNNLDFFMQNMMRNLFKSFFDCGYVEFKSLVRLSPSFCLESRFEYSLIFNVTFRSG